MEFPSIRSITNRTARLFLPSVRSTRHEELDFKARNKIRKAQKIGVELRLTSLDDDLVRGVKSIYDESPLRQGRKFWHYGKSLDVIKNDLSSFPERTCFVGAYHRDELIGFMKLYEGNNILRTVHIIAKLSIKRQACTGCSHCQGR